VRLPEYKVSIVENKLVSNVATPEKKGEKSSLD
jgi:hypothetical protein